MISSLRGTVLSSNGSTVVLEVGGVGFAVAVTPQHALLLAPGQEAALRTKLIVREDDLALFGFEDEEGLQIFELLIGVTGVGPKSALGVLGHLAPGQIAQAIADEDDAVFRKVSGIGPKTAKLITVSLAGKLRVAPPAATRSTVSAPAVGDSVRNALIGLGWSEKVAVQTVDELLAAGAPEETATVPALLRLALAQLGPAGVGR